MVCRPDGFDEQVVDDVAAQFAIDDEEIVSHANGRRMRPVTLRHPHSLNPWSALPTGAPTSAVVAVLIARCDPAHAGAVFKLYSSTPWRCRPRP